MASKRRPSPTEEDLKRIVETLHTNNPNIGSFEEFKEEWEDYFTGDEEAESLKFRTDLQNDGFKEYVETYPDKFGDAEIRGKEKQRIPKGVRKNRGRKKGYVKLSRDLNVVAREKGRVVYTSKEHVTIKGKQQVRFRDRNGRFASVPKERRVLA